jgi:hypothetical protein
VSGTFRLIEAGIDTPTKCSSSKGPAAKGPAMKGPATKVPGHERSGTRNVRLQKVRKKRSGFLFSKKGYDINLTYQKILSTLVKKLSLNGCIKQDACQLSTCLLGMMTINPTYPRIMSTLLKKHNYFELIFTFLRA